MVRVHVRPFLAWESSSAATTPSSPRVARFTRVCAYDRPNTVLGDNIQFERRGQISTPVEQPHLVEQDVRDLHALLTAAGELGPYVLVGHSYGGLITALYTSTYPGDVLGGVYVDVTSVYLRDTLPSRPWSIQPASPTSPEEKRSVSTRRSI